LNKNKMCFLIGAHKTGTTYIAYRLKENSEQLLSKGIRFESTWTLNQKVTKVLLDSESDGTVRKEIQQYLVAGIETNNRHLFIHENLSGIIDSFLSMGHYYPRIGVRMSCLRKILEDMPIDIVFAIRDYPTFILSCYSEYIRNRKFISFNEFVDKAHMEPPSWIRVIAEIANAYPTANVCWYEYSLLSTNEDIIFSGLLGNSIDLLAPKKKIVRPSISQTGIELCTALLDAGVLSLEDNKFIDIVANHLPKSDKFGVFNPLSGSDIEKELNNLYANHVTFLRSNYQELKM